MARYMCSTCHEVVDSAPMRFAFCSACGGPLTIEDLLPVQPITAARDRPDTPGVAEVTGA